MPTTPRGYRYPDSSVAPNVPLDLQNLATDVDTDVTARRQGRLVARSTTTSVANATLVPIASYDLGDRFNVGSIGYAAGIFTVAKTGLYVWSATVNWPAPASAYRSSVIPLVNGSEATDDNGRGDAPTAGSGVVFVSAGGHIQLTAGDTLQVALYQNSGGTLAGVSPRTFGLSLSV